MMYAKFDCLISNDRLNFSFNFDQCQHFSFQLLNINYSFYEHKNKF